VEELLVVVEELPEGVAVADALGVGVAEGVVGEVLGEEEGGVLVGML
jgi:hypothetical protein